MSLCILVLTYGFINSYFDVFSLRSDDSYCYCCYEYQRFPVDEKLCLAFKAEDDGYAVAPCWWWLSNQPLNARRDAIIVLDVFVCWTSLYHYIFVDLVLYCRLVGNAAPAGLGIAQLILQIGIQPSVNLSVRSSSPIVSHSWLVALTPRPGAKESDEKFHQ